jgi:hydroxymethylpyrimidine pyrophosphatase-like HAD family hydrolase
MVVTDLDGTLLDSRHGLGVENRRTLEELGRRGIIRVVSTGRSLFSALAALPPDTPIDYLCHSSGAGIVSWPAREALRVINMAAADAAALTLELLARDVDFMLHFAIPDNHHFYAHRTGRANADFERRLARYSAYSNALSLPLSDPRAMSQALVIEPPPGPGRHAELALALPGFQVIRTTSPLDGASTWVEIFPLGVNKAAAARWLRASWHGEFECVAVGNDYNDLDLLDWADRAFVVGNAPAELCARYATVASNDEAGFSEAVRLALGAQPPTSGSSSASLASAGALGRTRTRE